MEAKNVHDWPTDKHGAVQLQKEIAKSIKRHGNMVEPTLIAAVDTAYGFQGIKLYAAAAVLSFPTLEEVERSFHCENIGFPYHPGLFYFREGPAVIGALSRLKCEPDVVIVHGHGAAHPRRCGVASHVGYYFDKPSVGCARRLLVGHHRPIPDPKGNHQPVQLGSEIVGTAYRSKDKVKPIFISAGHLCDLNFAQDIVVRCLRGFRLPEPLRLAHLLANKYKRKEEKGVKADRRDQAEQL